MKSEILAETWQSSGCNTLTFKTHIIYIPTDEPTLEVEVVSVFEVLCW